MMFFENLDVSDRNYELSLIVIFYYPYLYL